MKCQACKSDCTTPLQCAACHAVTYCSRECQKADWKGGHKAACVTLKPASPVAVSAAPSPSPAAVPAKQAVPARATVKDDVELDADDLDALKSVSKGYRYFARTMDAKEAAIVGDTRPKRVDGGVAPTSFSPTPITAAEATRASAASAWNSAATFEERDMTTWMRDRLKALLLEAHAAAPLTLHVEDTGTLVLSGIRGWGSSSASIILSRGKPKFIYDLNFSVAFSITTEAATASASLEDEPDDAPASRDAGKKDAKKPSRVCLRFTDVSNDSEEDGGSAKGRDVRVEFAGGALAGGVQDRVRVAFASASGVSIMTRVRAAVEQAVGEFKAK